MPKIAPKHNPILIGHSTNVDSLYFVLTIHRIIYLPFFPSLSLLLYTRSDMTTTMLPFLQRFQQDISHIDKPERFTFPFCYEPHPLSILAAEEVQHYLENQTDFVHNFGLDPQQEGLVIGKMFGVLVVEDNNGELGYLSAVSGKLGNSNTHRYFVPPIYDMLDPDGVFCQEELKINALNAQITQIKSGPELSTAKHLVQTVMQENTHILAGARAMHKHNKAERKRIRQELQQHRTTNPEPILEDLIKQSYRDQHEYDVLKQQCKERLEQAEVQLHTIANTIQLLKDERKRRSAALQQYLFDQYHFYNAHSDKKGVLAVFNEAIGMVPPAGSGECAAPKLLQYAYQQGLRPVCMAEFWWGASPISEIRRHKNFYPSCKGKCEPILTYMMQGLDVDPNPMLQIPRLEYELPIIHEDEDIIVVNKPAEYLSVPGINIKDSVHTKIIEMRPDITGPIIIHRLDMSTSGILVLAKNKEAHQFIQDQFIKHSVVKRYTALLDGLISQESGLIDLPLRVDLDDRPRQMVCYEHGKSAQTNYQKVSEESGRTRIHFFPLTGRTHQLRVHAAHHLGLDTPIVGDDLYGKRADRLHLHAGYIQFIHPNTKELIHFEVEDPF